MANPPIEFPIRRERRMRMSYDEYFRTVPDSCQAEWVDGWATFFPPQCLRPNEIMGFMLVLFRLALGDQHRGHVYPARSEMRLLDGWSYRQPDVLVVLPEHFDRITPQRLDGPADIVVEVVSHLSEYRDRVEKLAEYAKAGMPEYWIVDGRDGETGVELFALGIDGWYEAVPPATDGWLHSTVLDGFRIDPHWFEADELPGALEAMQAMNSSYVASLLAALHESTSPPPDS